MKEIKLKHRLLYGFGYMGVLVPGIVFTTFVTFYYIQHVKLNPAWVGVGFGIVNVWEAIIAPFVGYISDRTRTRWGRRVPYVVAGIPIMAILLWLLFNPVFDASKPGLAMVWFMVTLFAIDSIFMIIDVNWQAVNAEMNVDLEARSQQGAIVGVLSMVGVALASSITLPLAAKFGWSATTIFIAIFSIVIGYIGVQGLKENPNLSQGETLSLKEAIRLTLKNKSSIYFLGFATIVKIAMFSVTSMIPLFAIWVLSIPEAQSGTLLLASSGGMLVFFPIAAALTNKIGPRKAMLAGFIEIILISICLFLPITAFPILVVLFGLYSIGFALILLSLMIILSDLIDADALEVGQRREGIYNSANAFMQRIGAFLFSVTMGFVLNASGFNTELLSQPISALSSIRILMAGVPTLVCAVGLFLIIKYPITDEKAKEIRERSVAQREELAKAD
jgi:GPH family glycoside/pentoside/hexuronide:cation symporter